MDGIRMSDTGEVDLELSEEEATAIRVALGYTLTEFSDDGCQVTRKIMGKLYNALGKLGVRV